MSVDDVLAAPAICSSHYTRSKALTDFKFAGVLPFCILHGESYVFLGAEPVRTGPSGRLWKTMCTSPASCKKVLKSPSNATALSTPLQSSLHVEGRCCMLAVFTRLVTCLQSISASICTQGGTLEGLGRA